MSIACICVFLYQSIVIITGDCIRNALFSVKVMDISYILAECNKINKKN